MRDTSASLLSGLRKEPEHSAYAACWERFVEKYTPLIYSWCRRMGLSHQDTEEVTQELMYRLVRVLKTYNYDQSQRFRGWLFTCTRNVIYKYWAEQAKKNAETGFDMNVVCQSQSLVEYLNQVYDREFEEHARSRVRAKVSERDWQIFLSLTETSRPVKSVAESSGLSVGNIYKIKSRVVSALQVEIQQLHEKGIDR